MVTIRKLSEAEAEKANGELKAAYWSFPIAFSIATLGITAVLHWLFSAPWKVAWWCIGGVFVIFTVIRLIAGNKKALMPDTVVADRQGRVVQVEKKGNRPLNKVNRGQYVEITLEMETIPAPYPQRDTFVVWQAMGMYYFKQDSLLRYCHGDLEGKMVRLTYLPEGGEVLAFEVDANGNPLLDGERVTVSAGVVKITRSNGHNEQMGMEDVDYVAVYSHRADDSNNPFYLNFRSDSVAGLSISSGAWGFKQLEKELPKQLARFDSVYYDRVKWDVLSDPVVVWRRPLTADGRILHPISPTDVHELDQGVYLENSEMLLPWGTYEALLKTKGVERRRMTYPNPHFSGYVFAIAQPVIFGLEVRELTTEIPSLSEGRRLHPRWPVTAYHADMSLGDGGKAGLEVLKAHFSAALGAPGSQSDPEEKDDNQLWVSWKRGRVTLKISVWRPYQSDDYRPACRLEITREPDLTEFYVTPYTEGLQLHDQLHYTVLPGKLDVPSRYTDYPTAKCLPEALKPLVQTADQYIVWRDERAGVVGIGNREFAHILRMDQVSGLEFVGEYWRDVPQSLTIYRRGTDVDLKGVSRYIGSINADDNSWGSIQEALAGELGLPRSYFENRQYY